MDEGDELLRLNTVFTDIITQEYAAEPELIAIYIPHTLPNECIDEVVNRHPKDEPRHPAGWSSQPSGYIVTTNPRSC